MSTAYTPAAGRFTQLVALAFAALGAACGGGGGSSGAPSDALSIALSPSRIDATFYQGDSYSFSDTATVSGSASGNVVVVVQDNGGSIQPNVQITQQSATTYTASFTTSSSLSAGTRSSTIDIRVCSDAACGKVYGRASLPYTFTVLPNISLSSTDPNSATAGGPSFTLTANGSGFDSSSVLKWNGSARSTTYLSSTQVSALIPSSDIVSPGTASISVVNGNGNGRSSGALGFTIRSPGLSLTSISPQSAMAGGAAFTLTATGANFPSGAVVQWNGSARSTSYVSSTQLSAQITAADIANAGSVPVTVAANDGSGSVSNAVSFNVQAGALSLTSVSPQNVTAGGTPFVLTVLGTGFVQGAVVQWNGAQRSTTYVSTKELTAQISAADIASVGSATVTVLNPGTPASAASNGVTVAINAPSVDAVAYQINPAHTGVVNFKSVSLPTGSKWSVNLNGKPSYALIAQGKVFVTVNVSNNTQLVALDQATGAIVWGPIVIAAAANAAYDNGKIFVTNYNGLMQAFDAGTGQQKWSANLPGQYYFASAPVATNGLVYSIGSESGSTIYAVDQLTGALIWTQGLFAGGDGSATVTVDGVYTSQPYFTGNYRPATGEVIWTNAKGGDGGGGATPVVGNGVLYSPDGFATYNGDAFDAESGSLLGSYVADNPPAIGAKTGYFLQSGTLRGITLSSNSVTWSFAGDGNLVTSPIVVNQYVFVGSSSGLLYALDGTTGVTAWTKNLGAAIPAGAGWGAGTPYAGLSAGDGLLVVPAGNTLTAFTLSASP